MTTAEKRAADETTAVVVAPREIHDLAYRASCVAGCEAGAAERIAHNVTFTEMHRGGGISALGQALAAGDLPMSAWVTAPHSLAAAEVVARANGVASISFEPAAPLAAIAGTLHESLERGVAAVGIDDGARGDATIGTVEMRPVDAADTAAPAQAAALRKHLAETHDEAHRAGIPVESTWFAQLEAAAAGYLVAEATLDAIDSQASASSRATP